MRVSAVLIITSVKCEVAGRSGWPGPADAGDSRGLPCLGRERRKQQAESERPRARSAAWTPQWGWLAGSLADLNYGRSSSQLAALVEHGLFDDVVRSQQQCLWDRQAQRLGGLEVDHQLELRRLFNRQVGWLGPLENLVHVGGGAPEEIRVISTVTNESTGL